MNKQCPVCGYPCEDTAAFCPTCGFIFPNQKPINAVSPGSGQHIQVQPAKKKDKTLWIVLGIVGGVLLLLFILFLIIFFVLLNRLSSNQTLTNPVHPDLTIFESDKDMQEYYYDDYDHASFQSESFVDTTTEEPTTTEESVTTEEPAASEGADQS